LALRFQDNIQAAAVGSLPNMGSRELQGGGAMSIIDIGGGVKACEMRCPAGTGTQRAEILMSLAGATQGQQRWFAMDVWINADFGTPSQWSLIGQQRRNCSPGNGPVGIGYRANRLVVMGGDAAGLSVVDAGPWPRGVWTTLAYGIYHSTAQSGADAGWVEAWRDGVQTGRAFPFLSRDTSSDGPGTAGSTLGNCPNNAWKIGVYRGGQSFPAVLRVKNIRAGDTRADVLGAGGGGAVPLPGIPDGLRVVSDTPTAVTVEANARPSAELVDYYVFYFNDLMNEGAPATAPVWTTPASAVRDGKVQFTFTQANSPLEPGVNFTFRVSAHNANGHGGWANPVTVTRPATTRPTPAAPARVDLPMSGSPGPGVRLAWLTPSGFQTGDTYEVVRDGVTIETGITATNFTDADAAVRAGSTYEYRIRYGQGTTFSNLSDPLVVSPVPYPPTGLAATAVIGGVALTWNANSDLRAPDTYQVYVDDVLFADGITTTSFTVPIEGEHAFRVSAGGAGSPPQGGYGGWSPAITATAAPEPITLSVAEVALPPRHAGSADLAEATVQVNGTGAFTVSESEPALTVLIDGAATGSGTAPATLTVRGDPSVLAQGSYRWNVAIDAVSVPVNAEPPVISTDGTPAVGETVSVSNGVWANSPTSYSRQWKRNGTNIAGATGTSYVLQAADAGQQITCTVTASNAAGTGEPATSDPITVQSSVVLTRYARAFSSAATDKIALPAGGDSLDEPYTIWSLERADLGATAAKNYSSFAIHSGTTPSRAMLRWGANNEMGWHDQGFGGKWWAGPAANVLVLKVARREADGTVAMSYCDMATGEWVHGAPQEGSTSAAATGGFAIGGYSLSTVGQAGWHGIILAQGKAGIYYTPTQVEALVTQGPPIRCRRATWESAPSVQHVWPLNQSAVTQLVPDTVGTSDQAADADRSGTTIYDAGSAILPWED